MAKVYSGGIGIATGFKLSDPQPIADYMVVATIADLTNTTVLPNQFEGMFTYVVQDKNMYMKTDVGWRTITPSNVLIGSGVAGQLSFFNATNSITGDAGFTINNTVDKSLIISGTSSAGISLSSGGVTTLISSAAGRGLIGTSTNNYLSIQTNNTEKIRVNTNGNVLIGTTTDNGARLQVVGAQTAAGVAIIQSISGSNTATANNDVLTALDISPTFNNGAFTGVKNHILKAAWNTSNFAINDLISVGNISMHSVATPSSTNYFLAATSATLILNAPTAVGSIFFRQGNGTRAQLMATTGNFIIQNGGTFTDDNINRLQVTGTISASPAVNPNQVVVKSQLDLKEEAANKQNSMAIDGLGIKFPTVDAVNNQANNIARAVVATGFLDTTDTFSLYKVDDFTLGINASIYGVAFSQRFKTPPFAPSDAVENIPAMTVPLSAIGLTGTGTAIKFVGYRGSDDTIVFSDTQFIQSPSVAQLGIVLVKFDAGVTSFIDVDRTAITMPDIAAYSNLDTSSTGVKATVSIAAIPGTLSHSNSAGQLIGISVAWGTSNNDVQLIAASSPTSFTRLHPGNKLTVVPPAIFTTLDPLQYWNGTALVPIAGNPNQATVQRLLFTVRGNFVWQYGEEIHANFLEAANNVFQEHFTDILPIGTFAEVGRMAITVSCTDLNSSLAQYYPTGGAGGGGGGSASGPTDWGSIIGSIDDQLDLKAKLDARELIANKKTTLVGNETSDVFYPSIKAVADYIGQRVSSSLREEFTWTSGIQQFTLANNYSQVESVEVNGVGLKSEQFTLVAPNKVTIIDTLTSGDYIIIVYGTAPVGSTPYYTQAQVDALLATKMDKVRQTKIVSATTYTLLSSDGDKTIYCTASAPVTFNIPSGLTLGNCYEVFQQGTGQITFVGVGATLRCSTQELLSTSERYALVGIDSITNVTEEYHVYGQLTAI